MCRLSYVPHPSRSPDPFPGKDRVCGITGSRCCLTSSPLNWYILPVPYSGQVRRKDHLRLQPDRAKILLERTLNDAGTNKAESYYYLGEIAFINKDYTAAAEYYKKGLEADPLFAYNLVGQGKLALNGSADKEQAEKVAEKYFKEALKGKNKKDAGLNLAIAKAYYETGTPGYEEDMKKSYKADKKFPDYFMFEGDVLVNQQQYGDACGRYENAIYFDPNCIEAYVKYSHIYFDINPTLAIQKLEELQTIAPNSAIAQREMAEAYQFKSGLFGIEQCIFRIRFLCYGFHGSAAMRHVYN